MARADPCREVDIDSGGDKNIIFLVDISNECVMFPVGILDESLVFPVDIFYTGRIFPVDIADDALILSGNIVNEYLVQSEIRNVKRPSRSPAKWLCGTA